MYRFPMTKITIEIGEDYMQQLDARLKEYGISHGRLARESGIAESQLSRWFNTDMQPRLKSIMTIETTIAKIRADLLQQQAKAKSTRSRKPPSK